MTKEIIDFIYCLDCKGKIDTICLNCYKRRLIEEIDKIIIKYKGHTSFFIGDVSVGDIFKDVKKLIEVK